MNHTMKYHYMRGSNMTISHTYYGWLRYFRLIAARAAMRKENSR